MGITNHKRKSGMLHSDEKTKRLDQSIVNYLHKAIYILSAMTHQCFSQSTTKKQVRKDFKNGKKSETFFCRKRKIYKNFFKKNFATAKNSKKLPKTHRPMPKNNLCRQ